MIVHEDVTRGVSEYTVLIIYSIDVVVLAIAIVQYIACHNHELQLNCRWISVSQVDSTQLLYMLKVCTAIV